MPLIHKINLQDLIQNIGENTLQIDVFKYNKAVLKQSSHVKYDHTKTHTLDNICNINFF